MIVDLNRLDTDPASLPWWRTISDQVKGNSGRLDTLISNNTADYKQLSASLDSLTQQYNNLNTYVHSLPLTETRNSSSSNWSVGTAEPSWGTIHSQTFTVPEGKTWAVIGASMQVQYYSGGNGADFRININGTASRHGWASGSGSFGTSVAMGAQGSVTPGGTVTVAVEARYYAPAVGANVNNLLNLNTIVNWKLEVL